MEKQKEIKREKDLLDIEYKLAKQKTLELKKLRNKEKLEETFLGYDLDKFNSDKERVSVFDQLGKLLSVIKQKLTYTSSFISRLQTRASLRRPRRAAVSLLLLLVASGMVFGILSNTSDNSQKLEQSVLGQQASQKNINIENIYFPDPLPVGYDESNLIIEQVEDTDKVSLITLGHDDLSQSIFISQQDITEEIDIDEIENSIEDSIDFQSNIGNVRMGTLQRGEFSVQIASIVAGDLWIVINSSLETPADTLRFVAENLTR